jgi:dihydroorotate dehydrogenase electron transfer subunit
LAQELHNPKYILLGARNQAELAPLLAPFAALNCAGLHLATDDGSLGHKGYIPECLTQVLPLVRQVYTCGPQPMMQAVVQRCQQAQVPCQVSVETHMACGIGACLGCVLAGSEGRQVHVCTDGPVFHAEDLQWT